MAKNINNVVVNNLKNKDLMVFLNYGIIKLGEENATKQKTINNISNILVNALGMKYKEYEKLDFDEQQRLEDDQDDIIYSKPIAFVKKLQRKIKNR